MVSGGHGDHIGQAQRGWVGRALVVVVALVSGGEDVQSRRGLQNVLESGIVRATAPGVGNDPGSDPISVGDPLDGIRELAHPQLAQELDAGNLGAAHHPRQILRVALAGPDHCGAVGSVSVVVHGSAILFARVVAVNVVHHAVLVVVDPVSGNLPGIDPNVAPQGFVRVINPGVDHSDQGSPLVCPPARLDLPRLGSIDISIGSPSGLPLIVKRPVFGIELVAMAEFHQVVGRHVLHLWLLAPQLASALGGEPFGQFHLGELTPQTLQHGLPELEGLDQLGSALAQEVLRVGRLPRLDGPRSELNQDLSRDSSVCSLLDHGARLPRFTGGRLGRPTKLPGSC